MCNINVAEKSDGVVVDALSIRNYELYLLCVIIRFVILLIKVLFFGVM